MKAAFISLWGCNSNREISVENCILKVTTPLQEKKEEMAEEKRFATSDLYVFTNTMCCTEALLGKQKILRT